MASEKEGHPMSGKRNLTVRTVNSVQDCTNSLLRHTLAGFVLHRFVECDMSHASLRRLILVECEQIKW